MPIFPLPLQPHFRAERARAVFERSGHYKAPLRAGGVRHCEPLPAGAPGADGCDVLSRAINDPPHTPFFSASPFFKKSFPVRMPLQEFREPLYCDLKFKTVEL